MRYHVKHITTVFLPAILISLLFVTPFIVSEELYNGIIVAKEFWFFGVVAGMLLYLGVSMLLKKDPLNISLNLTDILLIAFYAWCFIRACFTPYTPFWHNHKLQVLSGMMVVYWFVRHIVTNEIMNNEEMNNKKSDRSDIFSFLNFFIFSFILSGFLQAIFGLLQLYGVYPSHHSLFKITGSFFNPAPYALYLAAVFPVALGRILFHSFTPSLFHSFTYFLSFATVIAILLVLPATMIRASWLGALAGSLVVLQYRYHYVQWLKQVLNSAFRRIMAVALALTILALLGAGVYYLKKDSANGKLLIWEVTLGKILDKPLFGHGLGRFEAEYNNWQAEYFKSHPGETDSTKGMVAGNTKYCFNEYLELASGTGITGLVLFMGLLSSVFFPAKRAQKSEIPSLFNSLISSLTALLVTAAISFPLYSLPTLIILFILLSIISKRRIPVADIHLPVMSLKLLRVALAVLLMCGIGRFLLSLSKRLYRSYYEMTKAVMLYQTGNFDESCVSFSGIYDNMKYNGLYLQYYAKASLMEGKYDKSISMFERAKDYTGDEMLYCSLGDAYKATKRYDEAEDAYIHASFMAPHKLYPLYLLALLYKETGQDEKAVTAANKVLRKEIKVESEATGEIRMKMKNICNRKTKLNIQ